MTQTEDGLTLVCASRKPWLDRQPVQYREQVYRLVDVRRAGRGGRTVFEYTLTRLQPNELVRGQIVILEG